MHRRAQPIRVSTEKVLATGSGGLDGIVPGQKSQEDIGVQALQPPLRIRSSSATTASAIDSSIAASEVRRCPATLSRP